MNRNIKILALIITSILLNYCVDIFMLNFYYNKNYNTFSKEIEVVIDEMPTNENKQYRIRKIEQINTIIIHHSGSESCLDSIAKFHSKKWSRIGYHFVIDKSGNIFQTNYLTSNTNHIKDKNTDCLGICLLGNFDNYKPTLNQLKSTKYLINQLKKQISTIQLIAKHSDFNNTSCPGKLFNLNDIQ